VNKSATSSGRLKYVSKVTGATCVVCENAPKTRQPHWRVEVNRILRARLSGIKKVPERYGKRSCVMSVPVLLQGCDLQMLQDMCNIKLCWCLISS
jgi:hypothetical protein